MKELYRLLGIEATMSTAYHPQTDGQTERVNQELEQYLWIFVGERQDLWLRAIAISVWKSGPRTGKKLGLDQTRTSQDRKSQDRTGPQPQSGLQSFAILRIPGPVWTSPDQSFDR